MTTSPQTATLLPMTVPFSESLSETWLLERTYHAHLWTSHFPRVSVKHGCLKERITHTCGVGRNFLFPTSRSR